MKSDTIHVKNDGTGIAEALAQVERVAVYKELSPRGSLHLRLLAEEMLGMMHALTGKKEADFWIDDEEKSFRLHLKMPVIMTANMRQQLLSISSTGINEAAKGVMGKIRSLLERMSEPADENMFVGYGAGMCLVNDGSQLGYWSLNRYKESIEGEAEPWDELEKSVVGRLADEVRVAIADNQVEMIIYKEI